MEKEPDFEKQVGRSIRNYTIGIVIGAFVVGNILNLAGCDQTTPVSTAPSLEQAYPNR